MTDRRIRLLLGLTVPAEHAIEHDLYRDAAVEVVGSAADATELRALATSASPDATLVSPDLPWLEASDVIRLRALGIRTVGVALTDDDTAALADLDIDAVLTPPLAAGILHGPVGDPVAPGSTPVTAAADAAPVMPRRPARTPAGRVGSVLAVVGSWHSPGSSEVAASFAASVVREWPLVLAELDGDAGTLAVRLDVDPLEGSLLGLTRALATGEDDPAALVSHWLVGGSRGWPPVLLAPPPDLIDIRNADLAQPALQVLASCFPLVVCDVGHRMRRGGDADAAVRLHRDVVASADAVLLVIGSRPDQVAAGLGQVELLLDDLNVPPERIRVIVNGQPGTRDLQGTRAGAAIDRSLAGDGLAVDAWLPWDTRAAGTTGVPVAVARPRGGYARAVRALARTVLLPGGPRPASRKRWLQLRTQKETDTAGGIGEVSLPWRQ